MIPFGKSGVIDHLKDMLLPQLADGNITHIAAPKFSEHSRSKAEVATWLTWQKQPGLGLYSVVSKNLVNNEYPLFQELEQWLLHIFSQNLDQ